jgi:hypothetical protein
MEPIEVPNISINTPPRMGRIVLTNDTDDWRTPYCEFEMPNSL